MHSPSSSQTQKVQSTHSPSEAKDESAHSRLLLSFSNFPLPKHTLTTNNNGSRASELRFGGGSALIILWSRSLPRLVPGPTRPDQVMGLRRRSRLHPQPPQVHRKPSLLLSLKVLLFSSYRSWFLGFSVFNRSFFFGVCLVAEKMLGLGSVVWLFVVWVCCKFELNWV